MQVVFIADGRHAQHETALRHARDFEGTIQIADAAFDKLIVDRVEHRQVDIRQKLARLGVAQYTHDSESVAFAHFLLRLHSGHVAFGLTPLTVTTKGRSSPRWTTTAAARISAAWWLCHTQ